MHSRLQSLIDRGYEESEVLNLAMHTDKELENAVNSAFNYITRGCVPSDDRRIIYIGGQPGCGKTVMSMKLKDKINNIVEIGIDNYRMYHPKYLEIEKCIKKHWNGRMENVNDTPGNDIADFTHVFAGAVTDKLIEKCSSLGYNIILEWGMREPNSALDTMRDMHNKKYKNLVSFVAVNKDVSFDACCLRADVMKNTARIIRKVPKYFHDYCISTLPDSISKINNVGFNEGIIDYMSLVNRNGEIIWDNGYGYDPKEIYIKYLNDYSNDYINDSYISYSNDKKELSNILNELDDEYTYTVVMPQMGNVSMKR